MVTVEVYVKQAFLLGMLFRPQNKKVSNQHSVSAEPRGPKTTTSKVREKNEIVLISKLEHTAQPLAQTLLCVHPTGGCQALP